MPSKLILTIILGIFYANLLFSQVELSPLFSNHMVFQRGQEMYIWGQASPNEKISCNFIDQTYLVEADATGKWELIMKPSEAGGPYELKISANNELLLSDIMIGDVWLCSGQSNMEWPMNSINEAEQEIADANYSNIRLLTVDHKVAVSPQEDIHSDGWQISSPESVAEFSAVAYLFGRELHQHFQQQVPIGLIQSTWGGTEVETWISKQSISSVEEFQDELAELNEGEMEAIIQKKKDRIEKLIASFDDDIPERSNGSYNWIKSELDTDTWKEMNLPNLWENEGLKDLDGVVWFRKSFTLTEAQANLDAVLSLGMIDDRDSTWVNGTWIGATKQYNQERIYKVSDDILQEGNNFIAIKVLDTGGGGGLYGKAESLYLRSASGDSILLAGSWKYRVSPLSKNYISAAFKPNEKVTLLYNGMIHGLVPFGIKGAIWYQGESNASRAYQYRTLFPLLINDWRQLWEYEFPFLFVQLANFKQAEKEPKESDWAELREAQTMTLSLPHTAMASAIDIGEANDIHPRNKQDVAHRLVLGAKKIAYGEELVFSGPMFKEMSVVENKVVVSFDYIGEGLVLKEGDITPKGFSIAGEDQFFYWADAKLENNTIILTNEKVENPIAVRYAWADNPDKANLYNSEGLPAIPFRTDDWEGITYGKK